MKTTLTIILVALISALCGYFFAVYMSPRETQIADISNHPGRYILYPQDKTVLLDSQTGTLWTYDPKEPAGGVRHWMKIFERAQ